MPFFQENREFEAIEIKKKIIYQEKDSNIKEENDLSIL